MPRDLSAVTGGDDEFEDDELDQFEGEENDDEDEGSGDEEQEAERIAAERKAAKVSKTPQVEDDEDIEVVEIEDPKDAKAWKSDPKKNLEDPADKDFRGKFKKRIGKLTATAAELARERDKARASEAEVVAFARAQQARIAQLEARNLEADHGSMEAKIAALDHQATLADSDYRLAASLADAAKMGEAQNRLVTARTNAAMLKAKAEALAVDREAAKANEAKTLAEAEAANKVYQQAQAQKTAAPQAPPSRQEWFSKNPWFDAQLGDPKSAYALYQDKLIQSKGIKGDSPRYFQELDKAMQAKFPKFFGMQTSTTVATSREPRETQQPKTVVGNKVFLTVAQKAMAVSLGLTTPKQQKAYAIEIAKAERDTK